MKPSRSFQVGNTTTYGCQVASQRHKDLQGRDNMSSWWMDTNPECIMACPKPADKSIVFSTTKPVALLEEKVLFECTEGYESINHTRGGQAVCTLNGWSPKPQCLLIECETPFLENGSIYPRKDQYANRDVVKFSCMRGYTRVGPDSAQCYHFGWSPQPPSCKEKVSHCQQPPSISHGNLIGDLHEEYRHGEKVFYECDIRFEMAGSNTVECVDGEWVSLPSCTEEEKICGPPPNITNGHPVNVGNVKYWHGETVKYECEGAFVIVGTNPAKCLRGQWEVPSCIGDSAKCRRPKNAKFVPYAPLAKMFDNNRIVNYICGSSLHRTKCIHGNWSPEPECKEHCPLPPQLPNALNNIEMKNYKSGEKISFTCKEHFLLQGPQKILCEDGSWQTPPRCIDAEGRCGRPPPIENGDVLDNLMTEYVSGATVHYKCLRFYRMEGSPVIHCHDGTWTERPTCTEACTVTEEDMRHNNIKLKWAVGSKLYLESGRTAEFICKRGYQADPSSPPFRTTCIDGKMEYPICIQAD
ncbi:complement factor H-related protein 5-like isoform X2 [Sceloporus undulatus]|uniref:complement factor H-related protein 5-like isoform X2 n=1 Tax=Sceloporus undulatus TaxID=8520 RepID=UPI001C4B90AE|nr:complement factor H-related protein 5-like isoform X2 [Sceloporus undulatus]